ncbi:MAG TPA: hypothetical protein ENK92_02020 [Bacteroidetes bacterium]|nr:hypothetical protein [Bacteroidota bacterium]
MKRMLLVLLALVFISPMISIGAEKDSISVKLVWEKEIPKGVNDFVFLDENGYNVFSVQCKNPEKALKEKRLLMVQGNKLVWYEGDAMRVVKEMTIKGSYAISKNGHNIAVLEGLKRNDKGSFEDKPATLRLLNWKGEELARTQFSPGNLGLEYITIFPAGNDRTVAINTEGGEGTYRGLKVYSRQGKALKEIFSKSGSGGEYSEDGSTMFCGIGGRGRVIYDTEFHEIGNFQYHPNRGDYWARISPKGNYIAEVTTGKSVVIHNKYGKLISEHHVQGVGNYYGAFSPDEKYLLISPGFRIIYFFNTNTGNLIWKYEHSEDKTSFFPGDVAPDGEFSFIIFTPSREESKWIWIFNRDGIIVNKIGPLNFTGYSLPIYYVSKTRELFIKLPKKIQLYRINK